MCYNDIKQEERNWYKLKTKTYILIAGYGTEIVKLTIGQKDFFDWLFESGYISGDCNGIEELAQETIKSFPEEDD